MMKKSPLFQFAWFPDFKLTLTELSSIVMDRPEDWDYKSNPTGGFPILYNYIHHTFGKLECEQKILVENDYAIFNTGLVTNNQEEVYCYLQKNKNPHTNIPCYFIGWRKASDRDLMKFKQLPEIANYFTNPLDLIYDTRLDLRINVDHPDCYYAD